MRHLRNDRCNESLRWGKHAKGSCWVERDRSSSKASGGHHWEADLSQLGKFNAKEFLVIEESSLNDRLQILVRALLIERKLFNLRLSRGTCLNQFRELCHCLCNAFI